MAGCGCDGSMCSARWPSPWSVSSSCSATGSPTSSATPDPFPSSRRSRLGLVSLGPDVPCLVAGARRARAPVARWAVCSRPRWRRCRPATCRAASGTRPAGSRTCAVGDSRQRRWPSWPCSRRCSRSSSPSRSGWPRCRGRRRAAAACGSCSSSVWPLAMAAAASPWVLNPVVGWVARRRGIADVPRLRWALELELCAHLVVFWATSAAAFVLYLSAFPARRRPRRDPRPLAGSCSGWAAGFVAVFAPQGAGVFETAVAGTLDGAPLAALAVVVAATGRSPPCVTCWLSWCWPQSGRSPARSERRADGPKGVRSPGPMAGPGTVRHSPGCRTWRPLGFRLEQRHASDTDRVGRLQ